MLHLAYTKDEYTTVVGLNNIILNVRVPPPG